MADGVAFDPAATRDSEPGKLPRGLLGLALLAVMMALALAGIFGGTPSPRFRAEAGQAVLTIKTPVRLRSGLFFEQEIEVRARAPLADAVVAIDASLWRDITINTLLPDPDSMVFGEGSYRLHYGPLKRGDTLALKIDGQINPPLTAGTSGAVTLFDGEREVARVPLEIMVLP